LKYLQPISSLFRSKKIVAGLSTGALVVVILLAVFFAGLREGPIHPPTRPGSQQPNVQATDINILQNIEKSPPETIFDDPRASNLTFQFVTTQQGTYFFNYDNSFSVGPSPTKISVSFSLGDKSNNETLYLCPGCWLWKGYDVSANQVIAIQFTLTGGSPNDIHFYITVQTCSHTVEFSFTLVNNGNATGNATVQLQGDGISYWQRAYSVGQGQNLPQSGNVFPADCIAHNYNVNVTAVEKT